MSESSLKFTAVFPSRELAERTRNILETVNQRIREDGTWEYVFHHALYDMKEDKGIDFDSWWVIQKMRLNDTALYVEVIGSPSGTEEQDIVTWIKLNGAVEVTGKAVFDGGGDVDVFEF